VFIITGVRYIAVLFHTFYYYWAEEHISLYQGLRTLCRVRDIGLHCIQQTPYFNMSCLLQSKYQEINDVLQNI